MPPSVVPANLDAFVAGFFQSAGSALTTLLNRPITVGALGVAPVVPSELPTHVPAPWIVAQIEYHRGMTGTHWMLFPRASVLAFACTVLGEDATGDELRPEHDDAIREVVNQMLSSTGSALAPLLTRSVSFEPVTLASAEGVADLPADLAPPVEHVGLVQVRAQGPEGFRADWGLVLTDDFVRQLRSLGGAPPVAVEIPTPSKLDLILDVTLPVSVELGRARMQIQEILKLAPGSVIELDRSAGDPVELFINERPIARGEVVVIDENFGVRLTSIVTASERIKTLR